MRFRSKSRRPPTHCQVRPWSISSSKVFIWLNKIKEFHPDYGHSINTSQPSFVTQFVDFPSKLHSVTNQSDTPKSFNQSPQAIQSHGIAGKTSFKCSSDSKTAGAETVFQHHSGTCHCERIAKAKEVYTDNG